jgi:hypothetical protein
MDTIEKVYIAPAAAYTDRDYALYEAIIVRRNKTDAATKRIDKGCPDDDTRLTWAERGLLPEKVKA